ncbi:MAG: hypothetical protein WBY28_02200 [Nitrososphaeraceae archaeon]
MITGEDIISDTVANLMSKSSREQHFLTMSLSETMPTGASLLSTMIKELISLFVIFFAACWRVAVISIDSIFLDINSLSVTKLKSVKSNVKF